ncbi:hypothetical protein [Acinetobacter sp.]|uniref:hypothetical protein n=1 Tax=Acinetobacter sp. TaxID=472 RepID=UPI00388F24BF
MTTKKALVLTNNDLKNLYHDVQKLPFKRKNDQAFLELFEHKQCLSLFSEKELQIFKKCRYERNAHQRKMQALDKIQRKTRWSAFERDILELSQKSDINSYFLMLDALQSYVQKEKQHLAEAKLKNEKKRREAQPSTRKQNDREKYYLGAAVQTFFKHNPHIKRGPHENGLDQLFKLFRLWAIAEGYYKISATDVTERHGEILESHEQVLDRIQRLERILKDSPRNPFSQNLEG